MAGINIAFASDVRAFLKGTDDVEKSLDAVADSLDDLAREADTASDKIGRDLDGVGDDGKDAAEKLERSFSDTFTKAKRQADDAGDSIGRDIDRGFERAGEGAEEFKDEANSTAREAAASFDGSAESIADAFQEVAANAFAGFGPAGAAAGLVAAAGLGMITAALQTAAEEANALTERAGEMALSLADADAAEKVELLRDRWRETATAIDDARSWWEVWQPRATTNAELFAKAAEVGALNIRGMYRTLTDEDPVRRIEGLREAMEGAQDVAADLDAQWRSQGTGIQMLDEATSEHLRTLLDHRDMASNVAGKLRELILEEEAAVAITEALAAAEGRTVEQYEARQRELERAAEVQESYNAALEATGDAVSVYEGILDDKEAAERTAAEQTAAATKTAEDSWEDYVKGVSVSVDDLIAEWNRQAAEAAAFETNLATIAAAGGQALADELRAKGPEVAAATAAVIAQAGPDQQQAAIDAHALATGQSITEGVSTGIANNEQGVRDAMTRMYSRLPTGPVIEPIVSFTQAEREIAEFVRHPRSIAFTASIKTGQAVV
ncbi:hypothetical protein ICW40_01150 [Actinotalea ferrariae]|uniref:hypothetical protein n=1 Tax=Actinotalea ferrariae TaxID=1386098 RepID=UPI001C8BF555|nr:hypothetical protein [Actinotalea ferrariae]MBX9243412.1 hypothetical protein [Actinotalea ferrariae]